MPVSEVYRKAIYEHTTEDLTPAHRDSVAAETSTLLKFDGGYKNAKRVRTSAGVKPFSVMHTALNENNQVSGWRCAQYLQCIVSAQTSCKPLQTNALCPLSPGGVASGRQQQLGSTSRCPAQAEGALRAEQHQGESTSDQAATWRADVMCAGNGLSPSSP
jgi:hypothetical protein